MEETKSPVRRQKCLTMKEFTDLVGINLDDIAALPDQRYKIDVETMTHSIMKTTYKKTPVLALLCEFSYKRKRRGVLMLQFASEDFVQQLYPDSIFTVSANEVFHYYVNRAHDESLLHTGGSVDVCDNCFLINGWWKISNLVSIVKNEDSCVKVVKP